MKTARETMTKFAINYLKNNWEEAKKDCKGLQETTLKQIIKDIKENPTDLEWFLLEAIGRNKEKIEDFIVYHEYIDDNLCITVYKIKNKFIRETLKTGTDCLCIPAVYEFVKAKKKKITVVEYVPYK